MAENGVLAAPSPRGRADGEDAEPPEERMAETPRDDQEQFECQELLECQVQVGVPEEEEDPGLVAEAEAVAAGWMLDFLCLSLCRAFRDGRSEDFHRTRDSAEGECWARPVRGCAEAGGRRRGAGREPLRAVKAQFAAQYPWGVGGPGLLRRKTRGSELKLVRIPHPPVCSFSVFLRFCFSLQ